MNRRVKIEELGGRGDGIFKDGGKSYYIPYSVPGDDLDVKLDGAKGRILSIHEKSKHRTEPVCKHYTKCGGCLLQHVEDHFYNKWKEGLIKTALVNQGIVDAEIKPLQKSPLYSRRRTTLHAICLNGGKMVFGYAEKSSHVLVDVEMCPILVPEITQIINPIRDFLSRFLVPGKRISVQITCGDNGLDLVIGGRDDLNLDQRMDLASFAEKHDVARISWYDSSLRKPYYEMVSERRQPFVTFKGKKVFFPAGAFLQATEQGQNALIDKMLKGIEGAKHIVDLFSGCGTFSVAAAEHAGVHAVENNEAMLTALKYSANHMTNIKPVTTELRDLFLRPLLPHELERFDVAIIDPPRAGARHQMAEIIKSDIKKLVMVSCNPVTFARDVQELHRAGFHIGEITSVDQFLFSSHLEIIANFERA